MAKSTDSKTSVSKPSVAAEQPAAAPAKVAAKTAGKPRTRVAAKSTRAPDAVTPVAAEKVSKVKKPKLVRDSFTMPKAEYQALDELKQRAAQLGQPAKKSELLRAGIMALVALDEAGLKAALAKVPALKTGRPKQRQE